MRVFGFFGRIAAPAVLVAMIAGCAGPSDRDAAIHELNPAPMSAQVWSQVRGTYAGPIREVTERYGFEASAAMETRLDVSGWADAPGVVFRIDKGYSTDWSEYGEWRGTFTNIPDKRYGTQGAAYPSTHAPNQMLLELRRNGVHIGKGSWVILTFRGNGNVDVDWIGRAGWRGEGELWRVPSAMTHQ